MKTTIRKRTGGPKSIILDRWRPRWRAGRGEWEGSGVCVCGNFFGCFSYRKLDFIDIDYELANTNCVSYRTVV